MLDLFGLFYLQTRLFWRRLRCTFLSFVSAPPLPVHFFNFCCALLPRLMFYYRIYQKTFSCKYNTSRRLNVRCMKSRNIRLRFIASSFWTSVSYLSQSRAIIYCSINSSLLAILINGTPISNGLIFLDEGNIHLSYSTPANHYGSLIWVKYQKLFLCLQ